MGCVAASDFFSSEALGCGSVGCAAASGFFSSGALGCGSAGCVAASDFFSSEALGCGSVGCSAVSSFVTEVSSTAFFTSCFDLSFSSFAFNFSSVFFFGLSCLVCFGIEGFFASPSLAKNFVTLSVGLAPTESQYFILSTFKLILSGSFFCFIGLYVPSLSRYLPSLGDLISAATIL